MENDKVRTAAYSMSYSVSKFLYENTDWSKALGTIDFSDGYRAVMGDALTAINETVSKAFAEQNKSICDIFRTVAKNEQETTVDKIINAFGLTAREASGNDKHVSPTTTAADKILGITRKSTLPIKYQMIDILTGRETFINAFTEILKKDEDLTINAFKSAYLAAVNRKLLTIKKD